MGAALHAGPGDRHRHARRRHRRLHPAEPIRAEVDEVGITDTVTGEVDVLFSR
ncbi:hypothetical protein [Kutzneria kofuensis]|uniref:hypothetical protein n=1 Tax=Kutzneria kofuensis TaxID=103725 RepID=UPI0031E5E9D3